ncbi:MAG: thioredoxin-disulfide reductase [Alphaproteobacteria bacterium]
MSEHSTKVLIIGSGPAGFTAAIYAARASLEPIIVMGLQPGGQMTITTDVENYPGFSDTVQGPWLMDEMQKQAEKLGVPTIGDIITSVDLSKRPFVCTGDSGDSYIGDTLIISTGAEARWLGLESEDRFKGFGVSACATCDGFFFRGKEVCVVGGGNTAVEEALFLTNHATKISLIHRRDQLRAEKILQNRLLAHDKIEMVWDSVVEEVLGTDAPPTVTGVKVKNVQTGACDTIAVDGVFVAIGHTPNTELFKGKLDMDDGGYLITAPDSTATNIEGVYAAGDVQDRIYRQAVTAAATGCMAAIEVEKFLAED